MAQDISKPTLPPPLSLRDCIINGEISVRRLMAYRRKLDMEMHHKMLIRRRRNRKLKRDRMDMVEKKRIHRRPVKKHKLIVRYSNGLLHELKPTNTLWFIMYVTNSPRTQRLLK